MPQAGQVGADNCEATSLSVSGIKQIRFKHLLRALHTGHLLSAAWDVGYKSMKKGLLARKLNLLGASIQNASLRHPPRTDLEGFQQLINEWHFQHHRFSLAVTMSGV